MNKTGRMIYMKEQTEFLRRQKKNVKYRKCLRCDTRFKSSGNRICYECKQSPVYNECVEDYRLIF